MKIVIRKATLVDAQVIALIGRISFREAFEYIWKDVQILSNYLGATFSAAKITASLQKENNVFWLAFADDLPVGYAKVKMLCPYEKLADKKPAQLQKIYLLNDFIGQGIGEKLQAEVFEEMRKKNIQTLWLAVWEGNDKAVRFYERHGFAKETDYTYDFENEHFKYDVMIKTF